MRCRRRRILHDVLAVERKVVAHAAAAARCRTAGPRSSGHPAPAAVGHRVGLHRRTHRGVAGTASAAHLAAPPTGSARAAPATPTGRRRCCRSRSPNRRRAAALRPSMSSARRSRIALAYSVRFRRCTAGCRPDSAAPRPPRPAPRSSHAASSVVGGLIGPRQTDRRHRPLRSLRTTFSHAVSSAASASSRCARGPSCRASARPS